MKREVICMESNSGNKECVLDIETNGDPWHGRLCTIAILDVKSQQVTTFYHDKEEVLLMEFLRFFDRTKYNHMIGYNLSFDVRFIFSRCIKYRLRSHSFFKARTTDIMMILKNLNGGYNFNRPGRLSEWSELINSSIIKSAPVPILYQEGKISEILEYNKRHVKITFELWQRIRFVLEA